MTPILFALPGNAPISDKILAQTKWEKGNFILRQFPDKETYLRILSDVKDRDIIIICSLNEPDTKLLPLLFFCKLLRTFKVKSICLVAPYLSYMRQDEQFNPGEAITSVYFAELLSSLVNRIITIDPHLHRRANMEEIYSIPCNVVHVAPLISDWIKINIEKAVLIGPDSESKQWISEIAEKAGIPFLILEKKRLGDHQVKISSPDLKKFHDFPPVLADDIISTGQTMIETIQLIKAAGMNTPVCIGIHGIFAANSYEALINSGAGDVLTCNTITHESNKIDISQLLVHQLTNYTFESLKD